MLHSKTIQKQVAAVFNQIFSAGYRAQGFCLPLGLRLTLGFCSAPFFNSDHAPSSEILTFNFAPIAYVIVLIFKRGGFHENKG